MKTGKIKSLLLTVFGCFYANIACFAASLFSDYGQIQNVQNYSTNPFWTPNSPYNQKMPQPVYVQGNAVSNDECIQIVTAAVTVQCAARNNCKDTSLSDIRPAVIVQLSGLPNKAYSTACIGYLDTVYESYVKQFGHSAPTRTVAFPESYGSGNNTFQNNNGSTIIQNPSKTTTPSWQQDINERTMELQRLQRQNGLGTEHVYATNYPTNFQDLSFTERTDVLATGYKPYKDSHPYRTLKVYGTGEHCNSSEYANSQECMEYFCSVGGSKAASKECIKWRCSGAYDTVWQQGGTARTTYMGDNERECKCAIDQKSDECMEFKCKQGGIYVESIECSKWLCDKEPGYATQHKETCNPEPKVVFNNGGGVIATQPIKPTPVDTKKICTQDKKLCCDSDKDANCLRENCKNDTFNKEYKTICKQYTQLCTKIGETDTCCDPNTYGDCIPLCANTEFAHKYRETYCKTVECISPDNLCTQEPCKSTYYCCDVQNESHCLDYLCNISDEFKKSHGSICAAAPQKNIMCATIGKPAVSQIESDEIKDENDHKIETKEECCDTTNFECRLLLCQSEIFTLEHPTLCFKEPTPEFNKPSPMRLCSTTFTKNTAQELFRKIEVKNVETATALAKILFMCIAGIDPKNYDTDKPSHGYTSYGLPAEYNFIQFNNKTNPSDFIIIYFNDTTNTFWFDNNQFGDIWLAVCYMSGGISASVSDYSPYTCTYPTTYVYIPKINDMIEVFNEVFRIANIDEKALITGCTYDNTHRQVRCTHE